MYNINFIENHCHLIVCLIISSYMYCFRVDSSYIYKISYLLYVVIGCCVTLVVGWGVSVLATSWGYQPPHQTNPDLFTPPVAKYLRRKQQASTDMVSYLSLILRVIILLSQFLVTFLKNYNPII